MLAGINWNYNLIDQELIDGKTGDVYNNGTVCRRLQDAINGLVPKTYRFFFYQGLSDGTESSTSQLVVVNNTDIHYGTAVSGYGTYGKENGKTFVGWNTLKKGAGYDVSTDGSREIVIAPAEWETWLETWKNAGKLEVNESGSTVTINLYARWVDNVKLEIEMNGGRVEVTQGETTKVVTDSANNELTGDYQSTAVFGEPTRSGYTFAGWTFTAGAGNVGSTFAGSTYTFGYGAKNDKLVASWTANAVTVTFNENGGTWSGWAAATTQSSTKTKQVTFAQTYGKADENGKTWPKDPVKTVTTAGGKTVTAAFEGWYTAQNGGDLVKSTDTVNATEARTLYARYAAVDEVVETVEEAVSLNANHYTMESMKRVDAELKTLLGGAPLTNAKAAELQSVLDQLVVLTKDDASPSVEVYENKEVIAEAYENGDYDSAVDTLNKSAETGEISYVFPGKDAYTYFCYTNDTNPFVLVNAVDVAKNGADSRVSYPTTVTMNTQLNASNKLRTRSGMSNGTANANVKAEYTIKERTMANPYAGELQYFGANHSSDAYKNQTGYDYYTHENYLMLTPKFDKTASGKQYALYTFTVQDDSYTAETAAADTISLAGADYYGEYKTGTPITDNGNAEVTPEHAITIYVEYYNSQNGERTDVNGQTVDAKGNGKAGGNGNLEVYTGFNENGKWSKVDYLYRTAGQAANWEFIVPQTVTNGQSPSYLAKDPIYGQNDVGSFYYLMKSDDAATGLYWNAYDAYLAKNPTDKQGARVAGANAAMAAMTAQVKAEMKTKVGSALRGKVNPVTQAVNAQNGDYISWPYSGTTRWSTQFYAPAKTREDTLVYVHIYDRWGNTYTNILQRNFQDLEKPKASSTERGKVTVNETGGSGLAEIKITEYAYEGSGRMLKSLAGMTDGNLTWNAAKNAFTVTGLAKGQHEYTYSLYVRDNAGHEQTINFRASTSGSVTVTVNDEKMGGSYAEAAAAPQASGNNSADLVGEEAPMTMLSVEAVEPGELAEDTLIGAAAPAEEEAVPEMYSFVLNEIYTVNLFNPEEASYDVAIKSTAGGIVKAYVDGAYTPAKSGKITIAGGSQVQIRVSSRAGYELESLVMLGKNGSTDLTGTYNAEITEDVTIKAVFRETGAKLTITVENGAVNGQSERIVSPYSQVTVVAKAAPEGKVFAYWVQNGEDETPVSYDETYTFIATSSAALKAVYADAAVEKTAGVVMDAASDTHVNVVNGKYTLSYSGKLIVPEGAKIEEFGLVLTNQSAADCSAENLVIGGSVNGVKTAKLAGSVLTENGQCKLNVNNVAGGQTRTGRLYLVVTLADGTTETVYSNTWSELTTPAA